MGKEKLNRRVILALADILVLNAIKKEPMCRQDISIWFLREFDTYVNGSTLYPILMKLKNIKLIEIKKNGAKKVFYLTPTGDKLRKSMVKAYFDIHKEVLGFIK
ncbi:MAG: helix-turn-helix transcriptional regulator [Nanoarchaeota archaeon]|nr:helix-turn-helix transcriptional regulator [Nanoarchaeota archaeon]